MDEPEKCLSMASPATYRICVQGAIQRSWSASFSGMRVSFRHASTPEAVTYLTGDVLDQADLLGLLNRLYGLGLPLVSVQWRRQKVEHGRAKRLGKLANASRGQAQRTSRPKRGAAKG